MEDHPVINPGDYVKITHGTHEGKIGRCINKQQVNIWCHFITSEGGKTHKSRIENVVLAQPGGGGQAQGGRQNKQARKAGGSYRATATSSNADYDYDDYGYEDYDGVSCRPRRHAFKRNGGHGGNCPGKTQKRMLNVCCPHCQERFLVVYAEYV